MPHVLIADDSYEILYLVQYLVNTLGWTSDTATNGTEAWQMAQRLAPNLVITDVNMPGMSGLELVLAIKSNPSLSHIPVLVMSSADQEESARAAGCDAFMAKPFGEQALLQLLSQLVFQEPDSSP
jgi:CheY-like chemotaxis protein